MADAKRENGTIAANAQAVAISPNGRGCVAIELTGTWVINLDVKSLVDGTEENAKIYNAAGTVVALPLTTNQIVYAYAAGREQIIVRANGFTSGSAAVVMNATDGLPFVASAGGGGGGGAVTAANPGDFVDGWDATFGAKADASAAADNSTATYMSLFKRLLARLTTLLPQNSGRLNVDGAGGTFPVTNANLDAATSTLLTISDFDTKTGSLTETAPATDTASSGVNGRLQRVAQRLTSLIALLPTALGTTTAAGSLPVTLASDSTYATLQGGVTETAPATDTASSGANGRLQRIAQRLSSLIALLPTALISNRLDVNLGAAPATVTVQGGGANQAAVSGNPSWIAGSTTAAGGNLQSLMVESAANPNLRISVWGGANQATVSADGDAARGSGGNGLPVLSDTGAYNGSGWDRQRNNVDVTDLASAARTTTQTVADITVYNGHSLVVTLDTTVASTGSVTLTINYKDPASGKYILLLSGAAVTTVTTNKYEVNQISLAAVANVSARADLGRIIQLVITANNANTQTYSLGHTLVS